MLLKKILDLLYPRFITEDVVFEKVFDNDSGEVWAPVCSIDDVQPGEYFEKVGTLRSFTFMNVSYGCKMIGELRDFKPQ